MSPILLRTASQLLCWRSPFACSCAVWACRSWSLHVTNFKRRLLQMAVELRADNTLGLFDLQRDGLGGCCMGAARWPHVVALAAERWRGRNYKLWPVADRQVARVWSARGLQAASGDHVPTLASLDVYSTSSLYFSPAPPAPLPAHTKAGPALSRHRGGPTARAAPGGTASTAPRPLGAAFENGGGQRPRGAWLWLRRRTFRLMTCTDRMSVARRWEGVRFVSVGPVAGRETRGLYVEGQQTAPNFGKKKFFI